MNFDVPEQIVQGLAGAIKGLRLYPTRHPVIQRQFEALRGNLGAILADHAPLRLTLLEGSLFVENVLLPDDLPAALELARLFSQVGIEGLEFNSGLGRDDLVGLASLLDSAAARGPAFSEQLRGRRIDRIRAVITPYCDKQEEVPSPRTVYNKALKVVDAIFQDVRLGRIPSADDAREVVREMAQLTITDPQTLFVLSMLKDYDNYTFTHSVNVAVIALAVGRACGLDEEQLRNLGLGGLLHDLGKLKTDLKIITKPGRLTNEEFEQIRKHPRNGAEIVARMDDIPPEVIDVVLGHHLHYNRQGYPSDALGRAISPLADMAAIADAYDAMTTLRSYQQPVPPRKAVTLLRNLSGTILHPGFVERFIASLGSYPVGSLVRLDSGGIGLVMRTANGCPEEVQVKILFDSDGEMLDEPIPVVLSGPEQRRIVAEVDPFVHGVEVTDFFG